MEPVAENLGFVSFISQGDMVTKTLFVILIMMSILSWLVIFLKFFQGIVDRIQGKRFLEAFWQAKTLPEAAKLVAQKPTTPPELLAKEGFVALQKYQSGLTNIQSNGTRAEYLTSVLRVTLDKIQLTIENGVAILATVAATAPFVGLFGTVWGIYHALIEIGSTGAGTIDKVAGPVGEALIMTGLGLAVAIPAVMAHSWLVRRNRLQMGRLDSFAFELLAVLDGAPQKAEAQATSPKTAPAQQ
ncbi:MotA/TolQ/ExbB proton channel family protein [Ignatzschineria larvae DSM 13226]|uniref:Biopolymer transport protein ExbB n=1 Tax=Ignatzschineria larvae DSM 13226 TaxID=1111732 RepID=A0ABZ3C4M3_9GAMM|nr:MotA/TolQ/ExbB proton channel family protein [Ignatzschineria larvae]